VSLHACELDSDRARRIIGSPVAPLLSDSLAEESAERSLRDGIGSCPSAIHDRSVELTKFDWLGVEKVWTH
jgi:hypothetical protein